MKPAFGQLQVECRGSVFCARLKHRKLTEADLLHLGEELAELIEENGCRLLALGLGFDRIDCLYSMFLGKLVSTRRLILDKGGHMHLFEVGPASLGVLKTAKLTELFEIHPDIDAAVKALQAAG